MFLDTQNVITLSVYSEQSWAPRDWNSTWEVAEISQEQAEPSNYRSKRIQCLPTGIIWSTQTPSQDMLVVPSASQWKRMFSTNSSEISSLQNFENPAKALSSACHHWIQQHCLLSIIDDPINQTKYSIASISSELLLRAIDSRNIGAATASRAINNSFYIAKDVSKWKMRSNWEVTCSLDPSFLKL